MSLNPDIFKSIPEGDKALRKALKNLFGFRPRYLPYYVIAVTHRSTNEHAELNNERLEFLGDAILGFVVGEYLFKKYPSRDEGYLTEMRSKIVSRNSLTAIARRMGLPKIVRYNQHDRILGRSQIFGNALEALIGAIYLDKGFGETRKFILKRVLSTYIDMDELETTEYNFKNKIYSWAQKEERTIDFVTVKESFEAGRKVFTIAIIVDGKEFVNASGYTKKEAGQSAAKAAAEMLNL